MSLQIINRHYFLIIIFNSEKQNLGEMFYTPNYKVYN